jgi:hypothetical protein
MKKLIPIIALMLASFIANCTPTTVYFCLWSVSADTATQGQTISINATLSYPGIYTSTDSIRIQITGQNWTLPIAFKMSAHDALLVPQNSDGTRTFSFIIPYNSVINSKMTIYLNTSNGSPQGCVNPLSIYIKSPTTGIEDIIYQSKVKYFDMNGNETTPKEGLYIKEENGIRNKIFIM